MRIGDFTPVFGKNIRYLRTLCKLSQTSLGLLSGVPTYEIRTIEHAKGMIHLDSVVLMRILQVFGLQLTDMIDRDLENEGFQLPQYNSVDCFAVCEVCIADKKEPPLG